MKKQLIISIFVTVALCAASSWFSYRRGVEDGFRAGVAPNSDAKFSTALYALQHLRANEVAPVVDRLETSCYSGADFVLELNYQKQRGSLNKELKELQAYRAQYAKPSDQWSPVEADLENRLKLWQDGRSTEMPLDKSELVQLAYDVKRSCGH